MPFELIGPLQQKKRERRSIFSPLGGGGGGEEGIVTTSSITLSLSNFNAKTQLKISLK